MAILSTFYSVAPEEVDGLPKIPAQPIGYEDARQLLEKMGGLDSPNSWKGGMTDIDYKVILFNTSYIKEFLYFKIEKWLGIKMILIKFHSIMIIILSQRQTIDNPIDWSFWVPKTYKC